MLLSCVGAVGWLFSMCTLKGGENMEFVYEMLEANASDIDREHQLMEAGKLLLIALETAVVASVSKEDYDRIKRAWEMNLLA